MIGTGRAASAVLAGARSLAPPWMRSVIIGVVGARAAISTARAIWTIPQARITKNTADASAELESPATAPIRSVLHEVETEEEHELMQQLAAECFAGNPLPGRRRARMSAFYRHWVAAVRLEFPLRANRPSDRAAMSKWLAGQMRATGVRVSHAADAVPRIVALAINPSRAEVEAGQMADEARLRSVGGALWRKVACFPLQLLGLRPKESMLPPPGFN